MYPSTTLANFLLIDDQRGSWLNVAKRRVKFCLRCAYHAQRILAVQEFFRHNKLEKVHEIDPSALFKCTRSYLCRELNSQQRTAAQLAFYDWALSRTDAATIHAFYASAHTTIHRTEIGDRVIEVQVQPARGLGREGELALRITLDAQTLFKASFTVLPGHLLKRSTSDHVMLIGAWQGEKGTLGLFKEASLLMERIKPSHLLFHALQSLAATWNLREIVGVSNSSHAFASYRFTLSQRVKINYDQVWQELGATQRDGNGHWRLPTVWTPRPVHEIESKKRSAFRRRCTFRQDFIDACKANAHGLFW